MVNGLVAVRGPAQRLVHYRAAGDVDLCGGHGLSSLRRLALVHHLRNAPVTSFAVDDVNAEYDQLKTLGVQFTQAPVEMGGVTMAVLDDTCGNLIQIVTKH